MAHFHLIEAENGDLVDLRQFCSDPCHQAWCDAQNAVYGGWNGCHEIEFDTLCDHCGTLIEGASGSIDDLPPWTYKTGEAIKDRR